MRQRIIGILFFVIFAQVCFAQTTPQKVPLPLNVKEGRLSSKLMGREMPYQIILPLKYEQNKDARYPVIYLLHGLTGHYNNWTELSKLANHAAAFEAIVVTPEGENGWYTDHTSKPEEKWESYIISELIPEIDKNFRTFSSRGKRAIAGLSMGGYGSIKFGLKYPDKFVVVGSFSGALGAASYTEKLLPGAIGRTIDGIFDSVGSDTRRSNDIFEIVRSLNAEKTKALPFLYLDCGTEDFLFQNNREFVSLLIEKKVPHEYRQLPGAHNWQYWDKQVQEFLRVADRTFASH